jgi:hypothetical protein
MKKAFKVGDHVRWQTPQGETSGRVVRVLEKDGHIDGHDIKASPEDPRFEVESAKSGKHAVHRGDSLKAV